MNNEMQKCHVRGCKNRSNVEWPLISGFPALCSKHYDNPPKSFKELVDASNEPSDREIFENISDV